MTSSAPFTISSTAFAEGSAIPPEYSCKGADVSPELVWSGVPDGTKALVLFVDDPDGRDWVHWTALDLDPTSTGLPRGVPASAAAPQQGRNDFGNVGYGGPCPPSGTHHYRFTLYALDAMLPLAAAPRVQRLQTAMAGHVIDSAVLTGTYRRR